MPSESVFSRAFAEFSDTAVARSARARSADLEHPPRPAGGPPLPRLDGHRGPREADAAKEKARPPPKRKRGRLKKGEERPKVLKRLDRQATHEPAGDAREPADRL